MAGHRGRIGLLPRVSNNSRDVIDLCYNLASSIVPVPGTDLLVQHNHNVRHLDVLLGLVFDGDFEDHRLLMVGDRLLADRLDDLAEPVVSC